MYLCLAKKFLLFSDFCKEWLDATTYRQSVTDEKTNGSSEREALLSTDKAQNLSLFIVIVGRRIIELSKFTSQARTKSHK